MFKKFHLSFKITKIILEGILTILLILACIFWSHIGDNILLYMLYCVSLLCYLYFLFYKKKLLISLLFFAISVILWAQQEAKHDRVWVDYQSKLPIVSIEDNIIHVKNVRRDLRYIKGESLNWINKSYDLNKLSEVRFALVNLSTWKGIAHVFLSFNFSNQEFLSVSGEIRREFDETYSPFKGLFHQYEMMIVLGTEKDLIGLRISEHKDPITFYPLNMSNNNIKKLLLNLLKDCQEIDKEPRFYNTLTNNCATLIHNHLHTIYGKSYHTDLRLIFPGYTDSIAWSENLILPKGDFEETKRSYLINNLADFSLSGNAWSIKIRGH